MKITLHEGASEIELAPGGTSSPDDTLSIVSRSKSAMRFLIGADFGTADKRKGLTHTIVFGVWRYFGDNADAEDFMLTHPAEITDTGLITVTLNDETTKYYAYGNVTLSSSNREGVSTHHGYSIECGLISATREDVLPDDYE